MPSNYCVKLFLNEMNKLANNLALYDTNYANPHGLANS
jgi:D-alanyl-D-alanine carboxypeptidase